MKTYKLDGEIADFDYHSPSGAWSFCGPKSLHEFLDGLKDGEEAVLEINSPGGDVLSGMEMANAVKNSKAKLTAHVTGLCASMATVVACAADAIKMEEAAFWMIHNPWGMAVGDAEELRKQAALMDQMKSVMIGFYRGKFPGVAEDKLAELMSAETWYTGRECVANGLACELVATDVKYAARATTRTLANAPDAVKALFAHREMSDAERAAVDAARAAAAAKPADPEPADWETRYKGASRKINDLQGQLADAQKRAVAELAKYEADVASARKEAEDAKAALDKVTAELSARQADLDAQKERTAAAEAELAQMRDVLAQAQAEAQHLRDTRSLLTAGVLTAQEAKTYDQLLASARTPEAREQLRRDKATGKIK